MRHKQNVVAASNQMKKTWLWPDQEGAVVSPKPAAAKENHGGNGGNGAARRSPTKPASGAGRPAGAKAGGKKGAKVTTLAPGDGMDSCFPS